MQERYLKSGHTLSQLARQQKTQKGCSINKKIRKDLADVSSLWHTFEPPYSMQETTAPHQHPQPRAHPTPPEIQKEETLLAFLHWKLWFGSSLNFKSLLSKH